MKKVGTGMVEYFICNKGNTNNSHLVSISKKEYEILKNFHTDFIKYSNIFDCFFNFELSKDRLLDYLNMACSAEWSPEEIYAESKFLFLSNLLFGRILVDNSKSFAKQLELEKLRSIINDYEKTDEFKMMKLLRDFGQHFSLPITDLAMRTSFSENSSTIELYVHKAELERNKGANSKNDEYLKKFNAEKISLIDYFEKWYISIHNLFEEILNEFCKKFQVM